MTFDFALFAYCFAGFVPLVTLFVLIEPFLFEGELRASIRAISLPFRLFDVVVRAAVLAALVSFFGTSFGTATFAFVFSCLCSPVLIRGVKKVVHNTIKHSTKTSS